MGLFLDLIDVDEARTNDALEFLCKATHDHDGDIWLPMDSPLLRRMVELFTQRGLARLDAFRVELQAWVEGHRHTAGDRIARPAGLMERWNEAEKSIVKLYLEHLPPADWTLDDHMLAVDFLAQRYLPADDMRTEADWLSARASLMGRVQAAMGEVDAHQADALIMAMPGSTEAAVAAFGATQAQRAMMEFAAQRCAENVRHLSESARHAMRGLIAEHVTERAMGVKGQGSSLETKLQDAFGVLNRDMRRIAVTESGEAQTQGFVASLPVGARVKRVEQYRNACAFCRKIDGRVVEVVSPDAENKNWDNQIWSGKSNVGRASSPRKRVGNAFVERDDSERWTIPSGLVHPHCRGRWVETHHPQEGDDPDFAAFLSRTLSS